MVIMNFTEHMHDNFAMSSKVTKISWVQSRVKQLRNLNDCYFLSQEPIHENLTDSSTITIISQANTETRLSIRWDLHAC